MLLVLFKHFIDNLERSLILPQDGAEGGLRTLEIVKDI